MHLFVEFDGWEGAAGDAGETLIMEKVQFKKREKIHLMRLT